MPATTTDASRTYAGLLFWLTDKDNFYEVVVAPNGLFTVARKVDGKIMATAPVRWTKTKALKLGADAKNVIRVTLEDQTVVIKLNDTEVARFRGQAPDGPSHIGLVAASAPDATDTWHLSDLKVTNVASSAIRKVEGRSGYLDGHRALSSRMRRRQGSLRGRLRTARSRLGAEE